MIQDASLHCTYCSKTLIKKNFCHTKNNRRYIYTLDAYESTNSRRKEPLKNIKFSTHDIRSVPLLGCFYLENLREIIPALELFFLWINIMLRYVITAYWRRVYWNKVVKFIKFYSFALLFWTPQPLPASFLLKSALENGSNHLHIWKNIQKKCRRNDGVQNNCPLVLLLPKKPCGPFKRDSTNRKADEILRCMTRCYIVYRVLLSN